MLQGCGICFVCVCVCYIIHFQAENKVPKLAFINFNLRQMALKGDLSVNLCEH